MSLVDSLISLSYLIGVLNTLEDVMGFFLILLAIGAFLGGGGLVWCQKIENSKGSHEVQVGFAFASIIVGAICMLATAMFFFFTGIDKIGEGVSREKLENQRSKYVRLLNEDYNAENLSTALNFNEKQKLCLYKESGFMWSHVGTDGVCADTIAIPTGKFIPTQKINLSADTGKSE